VSVITYRILLSKLVYTGLIFLLVRTDSDYLNIPLAIIGGNLVGIVLTWYEIVRKLDILPVRVSLRETGQYLRDSSIFFLSQFATSMYQSLNTVVLGFQFSSGMIAQYGAANALISNGRALLSPISDSIYPYMVAQKNYKLVKKIILILEPIICLVCVGLFVFAQPIVVLICGKQYVDSVPIFRAMLPLVIISLPTYLFGYPVLGALRKLNVANMSVIVASIFHIVGLFVLFYTGELNLVSVALLAFCTECIVFTIRAYRVLRELKPRIFKV
jgi:PST family polysaccharide transporter